MFVLSMRFFGEPIRGPLGTYDESLWPFTKPHSLRIVNPRATVPPLFGMRALTKLIATALRWRIRFFMTLSLSQPVFVID